MNIDLPGFADPVHDAQSTFRAVLDALSRPGTVHTLGAGLTAPAPLMASTAAVLLAFIDADTPTWIAPAFASARYWIAFHCGTDVAAEPSGAAFVLCDTWPDLAGLRTGTDEAPEDGATVLLQVAGFGAGRPLVLEGPGLREPAQFAVDGLPDEFVEAWTRNHALHPRGVDLVLCAGDQVAALPRSTAVKEA